MTLGTPNEVILRTLGLGWNGQGDLGDLPGDQIDPKLEIFIKNVPNVIPN